MGSEGQTGLLQSEATAPGHHFHRSALRHRHARYDALHLQHRLLDFFAADSVVPNLQNNCELLLHRLRSCGRLKQIRCLVGMPLRWARRMHLGNVLLRLKGELGILVSSKQAARLEHSEPAQKEATPWHLLTVGPLMKKAKDAKTARISAVPAAMLAVQGTQHTCIAPNDHARYRLPGSGTQCGMDRPISCSPPTWDDLPPVKFLSYRYPWGS